MEEKHQNFTDIINKLSEKRFVDLDLQPKSTLFQLENFYASNDRHRYSAITSIIYNYNESEAEKADILEYNLKEIRKIAAARNSNIESKIDKLIDHVRLATQQKQLIETASRNSKRTLIHFIHQTNEVKNALDKVRKNSDSMDEKINSLEESKTKIYTEFVTILGIFTTIIFASFGGLDILRNILGNIEGVSTGKLMVFSSLTISAIIVLLFTLLSGIAKITGLNLRSCGCHSSDGQCTHNVFQKHPTVMVSNMILLYVFVIGVTTYFVDYQTLFNVVLTNVTPLIELVVTTFVLFLVAALMISIYIKKSREDSSNVTSNESSGRNDKNINI